VMVEDVKATLLGAGCMFTSRTSVRAIGANRVDIENVVIGGSSGDALYAFTYDLAAGTVSNIRRDGSVSPYSQSLADFIEWAKN
jgi:hypothetical protein